MAERDAPQKKYLSSRFELLVGLAGIARGFDRLNPFPENGLANLIAIRLAKRTVISAADDALTPHYDTNPALQKFYADSSAEINRVGFRKCALYTPNDRLVREPVEAGKLSDEWFEVPSSILPLLELDQSQLAGIKTRAIEVMTETHMEFIKNPTVFSYMLDKCKLPTP